MTAGACHTPGNTNAPPTAAAPVEPAADPWVIVPGVSIGKVHLGATPDSVETLLGKPDETVAMGDLTALVWMGGTKTFYTPLKPGFSPVHETLSVVVQKGAVVQIEVMSSRFHTADGGVSTDRKGTDMVKKMPGTRCWASSAVTPTRAVPRPPESTSSALWMTAPPASPSRPIRGVTSRPRVTSVASRLP
jgi:hypothetical protein